MNFKDWCSKLYGIHTFSEGKILNQVFLPATGLMPIFLDHLIIRYGSYVIDNMDGQTGLLLKKESYTNLVTYLKSHYSRERTSVDEDDFKKWLDAYFASLGIDHRKLQDYNNLPNIHIVLKNAQCHMLFMEHFARFYPRSSYDIHTDYYSVEMPPWFLPELYNHYYRDPQADLNMVTDLATLESLQSTLEKACEKISRSPTVREYLNKAHKLALDHDNVIGLGRSEASIAYAMSLRVYADLNKDNLSATQYVRLSYAANLLDAVNEHGSSLAGLTIDARYVEKQREYYGHYAEDLYDLATGRPVLADMGDDGKCILGRFDREASRKLEGAAQGADLNVRFLPDDKMQSDTDVIILQAGGRAYHSSICRIIKVGIMLDGQQAQKDQVPHYYNYFKVENNLGAGAHDIDWQTQTCTGTFVTKIEPKQIHPGGAISSVSINPFTHPADYEKQMAVTLKELIKTERQLLLYRAPEEGLNGETSSPPGSKEALEWMRLNNIRQQLSGRPHIEPVYYYAPDPQKPLRKLQCVVKNERGFIQGGGSCPVFSIKSLVSSVVGTELAVLHIDFLQRHNADGHLQALQKRNSQLKKRIDAERKIRTQEKLNSLSLSINSVDSLKTALLQLDTTEWKLLLTKCKPFIRDIIGDGIDGATRFLDTLAFDDSQRGRILAILDSTIIVKSRKFNAIDYENVHSLYKCRRMDYYEFFNYAAAEMKMPGVVNSDSAVSDFLIVLNTAKDFQRRHQNSNNEERVILLTQAYSIICNERKKHDYHSMLQKVRQKTVREELMAVKFIEDFRPLLSKWVRNDACGNYERSYWETFFNCSRESLINFIVGSGLELFLRLTKIDAAYYARLISEIGAVEILCKVPQDKRVALMLVPAFIEAFKDTLPVTEGKIRIYHMPKEWFDEQSDAGLFMKSIILATNLRNILINYQKSHDFPELAAMIKLLDIKAVESPDVYQKALDDIGQQFKQKSVRKLFAGTMGATTLSAVDSIVTLSIASVKPRLFSSHASISEQISEKGKSKDTSALAKR